MIRKLSTTCGLAVFPISLGLVSASCTTPSLQPEPFSLSGSWSLQHSISELPVADRSGSDAMAVSAEWPRSTFDAALIFVTEPPRTIEITDSGPAVVLPRGGGQSVLLYTDGRLSAETITEAAECKCQASWRGSVLFLEGSYLRC